MRSPSRAPSPCLVASGCTSCWSKAGPRCPPAAVPDLVDAPGHFRTDMAGSAAAHVLLPQGPPSAGSRSRGPVRCFRRHGARARSRQHAQAFSPASDDRLGHSARRQALRAAGDPRTARAALATLEDRAGEVCQGSAATAPWARLSRARFRANGLLVPDQVFGLAWSGAMTSPRLLGLIENLPDGLSEIYLHPATQAYRGCAPHYRYADELAALVAPRIVEASRNSAVTRGGFADF